MTESPELSSGPPSDTIARGLGLLCMLHLIGLPLVAVVAQFAMADGNAFPDTLLLTAMNFGFAQLVYVIPAAIVLTVKKRPQTRNGLLILAGIGLLITSACWGMVAGSF